MTGIEIAGIVIGCMLAAVIFSRMQRSENERKARRIIPQILDEDREFSGRELKERLQTPHGIRLSGAHFFELMSRLEDEGKVTRRVEKKTALETAVTESFFTLAR